MGDQTESQEGEPFIMSFGTYVAEDGDAWLTAVEKTAGEIEEFILLADDPDERQRHVEDIQTQLRDGKFFVLTSALKGIDILLLPSMLEETQLDELRGTFERLELADEHMLVAKLQQLRPKPYDPPARMHDGPRLAALIRERLAPFREAADEYFLLRDIERTMAHRKVLLQRLDDLHGDRARYERLRSFPIKDRKTGKTRFVPRIHPRWRIPR
ncbi:hypothetical protein IT407_01065 [Candidatus Uhrbacteria bacterium]|nr:hypothetical protein [Candidatus Uhrbacteria bacterium]